MILSIFSPIKLAGGEQLIPVSMIWKKVKIPTSVEKHQFMWWEFSRQSHKIQEMSLEFEVV